MTGSSVAYARSVTQMGQDLLDVRPTILIAVPRIFERVYGRISDQMENKGGLAKRLFELAVAIGWKRFLHQQGRGAWPIGSLLWPVLERVVASKIAAKLGGNLRAAISGGAPLNEEFGEAIGADAYCRDAATAVETARQLVGGAS